MKRLIVSAAAVALLAGLLSKAWTQNPSARSGGARPAATSGAKVGLIDMAYVFKNYSKFEALREDLKAEMQRSDEKARAMAQNIRKLQEELKQFQDGSPEYVAREKQLTELTADFEAFRKTTQRDLLRKESQIYKTIYLEVADAVSKYAYHFNYSLIIRFDREGLEDAVNPQDVLQKMQRQVVYHRSEDDITLSVLNYLNDRYKQTAGATGAGGRTSRRPSGSSTN